MMITMKPKEKIMKWLILLFVVANYIKSEYVTDVAKSEALAGIHGIEEEIQPEYYSNYSLKPKETKYRETPENTRLWKITRYVHGGNSSIIRSSRTILLRIYKTKSNNIDKKINYPTKEIRQIYLELPRLGTGIFYLSKSANFERNARNVNNYGSNFFKHHKARVHDKITEISQLSGKNFIRKFHSKRRSYNSNSKGNDQIAVSETRHLKPNNVFRTSKQNYISESNKIQVFQELRNSVVRYKRFIRVQDISRQNDRHQNNGNRINYRDNTMHISSEDRSSLSSRFISMPFKGIAIEDQPTDQKSTEVRARRRIVLNREKRSTAKRQDRRIRNREEHLQDTNIRQTRNNNKNYEIGTKNGYEDSLTRKRVNIDSILRFIRVQDISQYNDRHQNNGNRYDRIRSHFRDNMMRISSADRTSLSSRFISRAFSGISIDDQPTNQKPTEVRASRRIVLNTERRDIAKRLDRRIRNTEEILQITNLRQTRKTNNRYEESADNRHEDSITKKQIVIDIVSRRYPIKNKEDRVAIKIREVRERSENRKRMENRIAAFRTQRQEIHYSDEIMSVRINEFQASSRRIKYLTEVQNPLLKSFNRYSNERDMKSSDKPTSKSDSRQRRMETFGKQSKRIDVLREINIPFFVRNTQRNVEKKERNLREVTQVYARKENRNINSVRDRQQPKSERSLKRQIMSILKPLARDTRLNNINRRSKSNLHERNEITRQAKSLETQLIKFNESSRRFDILAGKRMHDRDVRNNRGRIIVTNEGDTNNRRTYNRNIYELHRHNVRLAEINEESHQKESMSNHRNARQATIYGITAEVRAQNSQKYRIYENALRRISNKDFPLNLVGASVEFGKPYKLARTGRNGKNLNKYFYVRTKLITTRNTRTLTIDVSERRVQSIESSLMREARRINEGIIRMNDQVLKLTEKQSVVIVSERRSKPELQRIDKLRRQFFDKTNLRQDHNRRNVMENNRERLSENKRSDRCFRGRSNRLTEIPTLTKENSRLRLSNKRVIFNLGNFYNILKKSVSNGNKNGHLLSQRNGRGYRGKFAERIAEERALVHNAKELDFVSFVNTRASYKVINNLKFSTLPISSQISVGTRRYRKVRRRVSQNIPFDNTLQKMDYRFRTSAILAEKPKQSQREYQSYRRFSSAERLLTRVSNNPVTVSYELIEPSNYRLQSLRITQRTNQRLNAVLRSRIYSRNDLDKLSDNENRYFDSQYRNTRLSLDLNIGQKPFESQDAVERSRLLSRRNRRQISRNLLDVIRHSRSRIETLESAIRNEIRKDTKREKYNIMSSSLITENREIQAYSALEGVSMSRSKIFEKRQSSRNRSTQEIRSETKPADFQDTWKLRRFNASSFIVNLILGLLIILSSFERNGIKTKAFKERIRDILFLRSNIV